MINIQYTDNPVYVVDKNNNPLMPTFHNGKVRRLLKEKKAIIYTREPFTIKLLYDSSTYTQNCTLGVDIGKNIGASVISNNKELLSIKSETRTHEIKKHLEEKLMYRRQRRNQLRYRKPRFNNRKSSKAPCKNCGKNTKTGQTLCSVCLKQPHQTYANIEKTKLRLTPSAKHKLNTHLSLIDKVCKILPVNNIIIETAKFDIQKINNPSISGIEYQQGEKLNFFNIREYILYRDNHTCQNPNCKKPSDILEVHHIKMKSHGGTDIPSNLITLCNNCHSPKNHQKGNFLYDWSINNFTAKSIKNKENKVKRMNFKDATQTSLLSSNLMRTKRFNNTFGSFTKTTRIAIKLPKDHHIDAFCIANYPNINNILNDSSNINFSKIKEPILFVQYRRHNRSMSIFYDAKYIDKRDGSIKTGKELSKTERIHRKCKAYKINKNIKFSHGSLSKKTKLGIIKKHDIVLFDNKYYEALGMSNDNVMLNNPNIKFKSLSKLSLVCHRTGLIQKI